MSVRTSSFSSATSCPSMTGPAASDSTLSPSVRSLSPISPLPNVPTFCLTPYPEQSEFPESIDISDSPITSPKAQDQVLDAQKVYPMDHLESRSLPKPSNGLEMNAVDVDSSTQITAKPIKPPTPKRRQTSPLPSFSIPPSLKMSSLSSGTIPSPTKIPPLSPGGRSKIPYMKPGSKARPRIGRSATISTDTSPNPEDQLASMGAAGGVKRMTTCHNVNKASTNVMFSNTGVKRKPEPLILNKLPGIGTSSLENAPRQQMNNNSMTKSTGLTRTKSFSALPKLAYPPQNHPETPIPEHNRADYDDDEQVEDETFSPNFDTATGSKTAKPLTAKRLGLTNRNDPKRHGDREEIVNQDRWFTELDLEILKLDMSEPRLREEVSPGWGEFDI